jgi:hypothetical protein
MNGTDRREFLAEVGRGMLAALAGSALVGEMGLGDAARANERPGPTLAALDRLAGLLQQTGPDRLVGVVKEQLDRGATLRELVAAGALANARAFAGQDYDGYHTFMALTPAHAMARELPERERALPIFKVLYRNSVLIASGPGPFRDALGEVKAAPVDDDRTAALLQAASRNRKIAEADRLAAALARRPVADAFDAVQPLIHDELNVHRVVLAWRSWEVLDFTGPEHARTLLRQTARHCADSPNHVVGHEAKGIRELLPQLLEKHRLPARPAPRAADDAWVERLARTVHGSRQADAAEAVAVALAEGFTPDAVGEAMSLAATDLILGDRGRKDGQRKPVASVHGDSVGVHASDAANAWRHVAGVVGARNAAASLIACAYHTAGQTKRQMEKPYPLPEDVEAVKDREATPLLHALNEAVRHGDQRRACAVTQKYGDLGHPSELLFALLLRYAVSEDGSLHAEKFYRTAREEFGRTRAAFRWRHAVGLARVTASMTGWPAPGLEEARRALKL